MNHLDLNRLVDEQVALGQLNAIRAGAPMVNVTLKGPRGQLRGRALVDTGAAHTFVTPEAVKRLGLKHVGRGKVRGIAGGTRPLVLDRYAVRMTFPGLGVDEVKLLDYGAYAKPQKNRVALVGRDSMAAGCMRVEYDGPSGQVKVSKSKRRR